jgi:hypothetical protein
MDVRGGHHRLLAPSIVCFVQPLGDPPLASFDLFSYLGVHSKTLRASGKGLFNYPLNTRKRRGFSHFSRADAHKPIGLRLA